MPLLAICALLLLRGPGAAESAIALAPGMPALRTCEAPPLYKTLPDADVTNPGAAIEPVRTCRWVYDSGAAVTFMLRGAGGGTADRCLLTVWDWENRPVAERPIAVGAADRVRFAVRGRGTYLLSLDGFRGAKCVFRLARSFCVCPPNNAARQRWAFDEFFIGTCSFPARQTWTNGYGTASGPGLTPEQSADLDAELVARTGLQVARIDAVSKMGDRGSGWLDTAATDPGVRSFVSRGVRLDIQLWGPPPVLPAYEKRADPLWRYPRLEGPYRAYIREAAARYARYAAFFEIGNEPDNLDFWRGTPEEYVAQHGWAVQELRRAARGAVLANGGYCLVKPEWTPIIARGIRGQADLAAYHSHGDLPTLTGAFNRISRIHEEAGYRNPRYVNTEMGWAAWRLDQERNQAVTALHKTLYCWAHRHRGVLLYCSREVGGPRQKTGGEADWGFTDHTFCPRFAYGALTALIATLTGARFDRTLVEGDDLHVYAFRAPGKTIVYAFTLKGERALTLAVDGRVASVSDAMGNRRRLAGQGSFTFRVGQYPVAVELRGTPRIRITGISR